MRMLRIVGAVLPHLCFKEKLQLFIHCLDPYDVIWPSRILDCFYQNIAKVLSTRFKGVRDKVIPTSICFSGGSEIF